MFPVQDRDPGGKHWPVTVRFSQPSAGAMKGRHGMAMQYLMCSFAVTVRRKSVTSVSGREAYGAVEQQGLMNVLVMAYLMRVFMTELRCAICVLCKEGTIDKCVSPATQTMSEKSQVTMMRIQMRGFGQVRI